MFYHIFDDSSSVYDDSTSYFDLISYEKQDNQEDMSNSFISLNPQKESSLYQSKMDTINDGITLNISQNEMILSPETKLEQISISSKNIDNNPLKIGKKRGRQNDKVVPQHTVFKNDCRMAKIQTSYFTFLIFLLNSILKKLNIKYKFLQLDGKYKSNINQKSRAMLNLKTLKEIIEEAPLSLKYKKDLDKNHNKKIIEKLKEEGHYVILNLLDKKFLYFFGKIYFVNLKKFNLSSFELDPLDVELLPQTKLFKDLLDKNKNKNEKFDKYKSAMEKCTQTYFSNANKIIDISEKKINSAMN